jgi:hypothetical protein
VENLLVSRKRALLKLDLHEVRNTSTSNADIRSSIATIAKIQHRATKLAIPANNISVIAISAAMLPHPQSSPPMRLNISAVSSSITDSVTVIPGQSIKSDSVGPA